MAKRGLPDTLRMRHDEHYVETLAASAGSPVGKLVAIDLLETIEKVRLRPNPGLRILGVVITMHDKRTSLARDIREQIQKVFGPKVFRTVIGKSVRLEESPAYKESIFTFAPDSPGATEYYRLCEEVIDRA